MSTVCIAYAFTCLGFCLGFAAAAVLRANRSTPCECAVPDTNPTRGAG